MNAKGIVSALAVRELVRLSRQPARVIGAIGAPVLAWVLLGAGFAGSFAPPGEEAGAYGRYLVPGIASLTVLFSAIFAAISLIEDRDLGVLRAIAAGPAPGWTIALGKVVGASVVAVAQGGVVMLAGLLVGLPLGGVAAGVLCLVPLSFGIAGVSLAAGWRCGSVSGFHSVMNLVLMPAWLLSGAAFPVDGSAGWMGWLMRLNPLTYATGALRSAAEGSMPMPGDLVGLLALGLAGPVVAAWAVRRGRRSF